METLTQPLATIPLETETQKSRTEQLVDAAFWQIVEPLGFLPDFTVNAPDTSDRNAWQKISDATGTVVTPANAIDVLGFAGAKYGIDNLDSWKGIGVACASFMTDAIDGKIARATGTQSELGEALDAAGDKVKLAYALVKIWQMDLAPKSMILAIAVQNGLNAGLTIFDQATNKGNTAIHPSFFGKKAIFMEQWGIGLHVVGSQMEKDEIKNARGVKIAGSVLGWAGVAVGTVASGGYIQALKAARLAK